MSLSDSDLELLESHLDGELSVAEDEALRDRMNIEPELATVLETLRSERNARCPSCFPARPGAVACLTLRLRKPGSRRSARPNDFRTAELSDGVGPHTLAQPRAQDLRRLQRRTVTSCESDGRADNRASETGASVEHHLAAQPADTHRA